MFQSNLFFLLQIQEIQPHILDFSSLFALETLINAFKPNFSWCNLGLKLCYPLKINIHAPNIYLKCTIQECSVTISKNSMESY